MVFLVQIHLFFVSNFEMKQLGSSEKFIKQLVNKFFNWFEMKKNNDGKIKKNLI